MSDNQDLIKVLAAATSKLTKINRMDSFDPNIPGSVATPAQQEIIDDFGHIPTQWIVASNRSGKSQTCAKLIAHALTDTHPTWSMPEEWKREGLLILIAGKNSKQIEESLWHKVKSYLELGTYKEIRSGNSIQKVEVDNPNGDKHRILFQSMENVNIARERIQSYDAHIAWADEMIDSAATLNEIRLRVVTKRGYFLCSFTPLKPSLSVKKLIDGAELPHAKRYNLKTLDNPLFRNPKEKEALLSTFVGASAASIATRLEGEWAVGETQVYQFDYDVMVRFPEGYSPMWRHVESIDPALKSAAGLTIWAENPITSKWFCIRADYVKGILIPTELVSRISEMTTGLNIVKRIADPHEVWYIETARSMGIKYHGVHKKNERKGDLIKGLQQFLGNDGYISPGCEHLISELQECRWSDRTDNRIVNASSYHLLDSAQYFVDEKPKPESKKIISTSWEDWLYQANNLRLEEIEKHRLQKERRSTPTRKKILSRRSWK